ncbi:MAG: LptF/LptG family permease [Phycisphaerae bacterium]
MISTLDKYILRSLIVNYSVALCVMISLYVTLDMFVNMDEFTEHGYPLSVVVGNIFSYYWPNIFLYFSQLSGAITLFSCMAVLARMRKLNELTAILASGVSLFRVARPIVLFGVCTTALLVVDTELCIPAVAHLLARDHDDADGKRAYEVLFLKDRDGALLSAGAFHPLTREMQRMLVLTRDAAGKIVKTVEADRAHWEPPSVTQPVGRWQLERGRSVTRSQEKGNTLRPRGSVREEPVKYYDSDLSPEAILMRQAEGWISYLSLSQLREQERAGISARAPIMRAKHNRVAAPLVSLVLLLLGLPFFLDRSPANVLGDTGKCLLACGGCYVTNFVMQSLRPETETALMAWIPIFVFATVAMVLIDRIRT